MTNRAQIETTVTKICRLDRILLALPLSATTLFRYLEVRPNDRGHVPCLMFTCALCSPALSNPFAHISVAKMVERVSPELKDRIVGSMIPFRSA